LLAFVHSILAVIVSRTQPERLSRPLCINRIRDGGIYELQVVSLIQTNLFLKVGRLDELFIKVPSDRGMNDYRTFVKLARSSPEDIRSVERAERFESLEEMLERFAAFKGLIRMNAEFAHYLVVHKLQYERLRRQTAVEIPQARFGFLKSDRQWIFTKCEPALFQEWVRGTTLWTMFDFTAQQVRPRWQPFLPTISAQLSELLNTGITNHLDWNIKNFVFDETEERLFYVDLKPTIFVAKYSNERNLKGIRDHFLL
jgi:hypothetical protein